MSLAWPRLLLRRLSSFASKGQYAYGCNFSPFLRTSPPPLALYRSPVCVAEVLVVLFVLVDLLVFVVRLVLPDLRVPNVRRVAPSSSSSSSSRARLRSFSSTILSLPVDLSVLYFVPSSSASPNSFRLYCAVFAPCASRCLRIFESSSKSNSAPTGSRAPALALEACASRALRNAPSEPPLFPRWDLGPNPPNSERWLLLSSFSSPKISSSFQRLLRPVLPLARLAVSSARAFFFFISILVSSFFMCDAKAKCSFGMASSTARHPHRFAHRSTITFVFNLNLFLESEDHFKTAGRSSGKCEASSFCGKRTATTFIKPNEAFTTSLLRPLSNL